MVMYVMCLLCRCVREKRLWCVTEVPLLVLMLQCLLMLLTLKLFPQARLPSTTPVWWWTLHTAPSVLWSSCSGPTGSCTLLQKPTHQSSVLIVGINTILPVLLTLSNNVLLRRSYGVIDTSSLSFIIFIVFFKLCKLCLHFVVEKCLPMKGKSLLFDWKNIQFIK